MESQNYIGPQVPKKVSLNEKFKSRFKCKNCSFSGRTLTLGGHLAKERNSSCRLFYMRELEEEKLKKAPELAFMEEVASDPASAEPSANSQSTDAAELSMLVPEVKIRLAKERPFRCSDCSYTAVTRAHLVSHVKSVHKVSPIPVAITYRSSNNPVVTYYKCDRCGDGSNLYSSRNTLIGHIRKMHGPLKVEFCSKCSFASTMEGVVQKHLSHAHEHAREKVENGTVAQKKLVPVSRRVTLEKRIKNPQMEMHDTPSTSRGESPNKRVKVIEVGSNTVVSKEGIYRVLKSGVLKAEHTITSPGRPLKTEHDEKRGTPFRCEQCQYVTFTDAGLRSHLQSDHGGFVCQECGYHFNIEYQLKVHNASYHNHAERYRCESSVEEKHRIGASTLIRTVKCEYSTTGKKEFQEHVFRVHGSATIRYCGQCFFVATVLAEETSSADGIIANHICEAHGSVGVKKTFKCGVQTCTFSATSIANLNKHAGLVHNLRRDNFVCKECGKRFLRGPLLLRHVQSEHGRKSWHFCEVCKKYFQDKALLDKHMRTLHKKATCYDCDYVSEDAFDLSNHVRVAHMGMPRYDFIQKRDVPPPVPEVILPDVPIKSEPTDQPVSFLDVDMVPTSSNAKGSDSKLGDVIDCDPIDVSTSISAVNEIIVTEELL